MKKKIFVNKEDSSFQNKNTFDEIMDNLKAFGGSVIKNGKKTFTLVTLLGCVAISAVSIDDLLKEVIGSVRNVVYAYPFKERVRQNNDEMFFELKPSSIIVTNYNTSITQDYYFKNGYLYDVYGNLVDLKNEEKNIIFSGLVIDYQTLSNINLRLSKAKEIVLDYSSIDNSFIECLPESLEYLSINHCNFVTDLNGLVDRCPNIKGISVDCVVSLSDLSFIYQTPNLEYLHISNNAYVTYELLEYLNEHGIEHNLSEQDILNAQRVDAIVSEIITDDMSDEEKIQAICLYVINNLEYDMKYAYESNYDTLNNALNDNKGVCKSYAYLTAVLMNKAGLSVYEVENDSHAWNIVKLDDEYFYIDTTNFINFDLSKYLFEKTNVSINYMYDTEGNFYGSVGNTTSYDIRIPTSLLVDILKSRTDKDILEKYSGFVNSSMLIISVVLLGYITGSGPSALKKSIKISKELYSDIKEDYFVLKREKISRIK